MGAMATGTGAYGGTWRRLERPLADRFVSILAFRPKIDVNTVLVLSRLD